MVNWITIIFIISILIIVILLIRRFNIRRTENPFNTGESFMNKLGRIKRSMIDCCTGKGRRRI